VAFSAAGISPKPTLFYNLPGKRLLIGNWKIYRVHRQQSID
jgi:hypothetical protein